MDCPNCGKMVFDAYTTEDRIKQLYQIYHSSGWAKTRLDELIGMLDEKEPHTSDRVSLKWLRDNLIQIRDGIKVLKDEEGFSIKFCTFCQENTKHKPSRVDSKTICLKCGGAL